MRRIVRKSARVRRSVQWVQEALESRVLLSQVNFTVTNTNDMGSGSLRQAITNANALPSGDLGNIQFKIPGTGVHTIKPLSGLPFITGQVDINGTTDSKGNPLIELDGEKAGKFSDGLFLERNTPGNTVASEISGLIINRFGDEGIDINDGKAIIFGCRIGTNSAGTAALPNGRVGILVEGQGSTIGEPGSGPAFQMLISGNKDDGINITSSNNVIQNCLIGTDLTGTKAIGNGQWGIEVSGGNNNDIGEVAAHDGMVVSANGAGGIHITGPFTDVVNSMIGTDITGNKALGNKGNGVEVDNTHDCSVGGFTIVGAKARAGNVISGNMDAGVADNGSNNTSITNNMIGTNASGKSALGNKLAGVFIDAQNCSVQQNFVCANGFDGIVVEEDAFKAQNNKINGNFIGAGVGGVALGNKGDGVLLNIGTNNAVSANVIAFNKASGEDGYGVDVMGHAATGNTITDNSIFSNARLGINLGLETGNALPNDNKDPDSGPNNLQNYPVITSVKKTTAGIVIKGSLNSIVNSKLHIEFFASASPDPSGFGEGQTPDGAKTVTTNASGIVTFTVTVKPVSGEVYWTATATDAGGNTSEFSKAVKQS
jgi:hypothetical protein